MSRYSLPSDFSPSLPKPALCVMAQGNKEVRLGDEYFAYDPLNYLVVSVSMPISGRVLEISPEHPVLALRLDIDPAEIATLISAIAIAAEIILISAYAGKVDVRRVTVVQLSTASILAFLMIVPTQEAIPDFSYRPPWRAG